MITSEKSLQAELFENEVLAFLITEVHYWAVDDVATSIAGLFGRLTRWCNDGLVRNIVG